MSNHILHFHKMNSALTAVYDDRRWRFVFIIIVTFLWQYLFLYNVTPLILFEGTDSIVFKQMGLALLQGKRLYIDIFDHKGPVLYFLNSIPLLFGNGRWGLFLFHVINYSIATYIWTETISTFLKGIKGIYPVFLGVVLYLYLNAGGNSSEDWCIIPISYAIYIGIKSLTGIGEKPIPTSSLIYLGISAAFVFFIRANNDAPILCTFLLLLYLDRNQWSRIILFVTLGFSLVTFPVLFYFFVTGGCDYVYSMIMGSILFNIDYAAKAHEDITLFETPFFISYTVLALILMSLSILKKQVSNKLILYIASCFFLSIAVMGHNNYSHYLIILVPLYVPLSAMALSDKKHFIWCFFLFLIMLVMKLPLGMVHSIIVNRNGHKKFYEATDSLISRIPQENKEKIWNYNTEFVGPSILHRNGIVQCNKIFHLFQIGYSEELKKEREDELYRKSPEWIIVNDHSHISSKDSICISRNYVIDTEIVFKNQNTKAVFYRKIK